MGFPFNIFATAALSLAELLVVINSVIGNWNALHYGTGAYIVCVPVCFYVSVSIVLYAMGPVT